MVCCCWRCKCGRMGGGKESGGERSGRQLQRVSEFLQGGLLPGQALAHVRGTRRRMSRHGAPNGESLAPGALERAAAAPYLLPRRLCGAPRELGAAVQRRHAVDLVQLPPTRAGEPEHILDARRARQLAVERPGGGRGRLCSSGMRGVVGPLAAPAPPPAPPRATRPPHGALDLLGTPPGARDRREGGRPPQGRARLQRRRRWGGWLCLPPPSARAREHRAGGGRGGQPLRGQTEWGPPLGGGGRRSLWKD